jgi:hypothetical protein
MKVQYARYFHYDFYAVDGRMIYEFGIEDVPAPATEEESE